MTRRLCISLAVTAALGVAAGGQASAATPLKGTLKLSPGRLVKKQYTGTYFRMILPGATDKYFKNADSRAKDKTYTLLRPGTDGGLILGTFQRPPSPAFAGNGFALARRVTLPEKFAGIAFSISTAPVDAQSHTATKPPALAVTGNRVTGDFRAWTAEWNSIYFNQGAPKPNNSFPGLTRPVNGTYNKKTKRFEIVWYSQIIGGPFNRFTGYWHLQGKLVP